MDVELKKFFKPEFLNRLDEIVIFKNLDLTELREITKIQLKELESRLIKKDLKLQISNEAIDHLVKNSFDNNYGARPLKRTIQKEIETKIANNILNNNYSKKKEVYISIKEGCIFVD